VSRLSRATLAGLPAAIDAPRTRGPVATGIVHFGPGAFHRAHQAAYVDRLLDHDPRWGIAAVSLRSRGTVEALAAQDGLYTLAIRDAEPRMRVIGAHTAFLGPENAQDIRDLLMTPETRLVTTTITEKGYCLAPDGTLDMAHPDIVHDLKQNAVPRTVYGWLAGAIEKRDWRRSAPLILMPCDNLANNGRKLHAALVAFVRATDDPAFADWIESEIRVPSTMVDSITPASDDVLYADVAAALGVEDRAAVQREHFAQWVIEDIGGLPDLAGVGATVTGDVGGYERAKLRILNGAHSTLAYAGLLRGHVSVADAMGDAALAGFVDRMIRDDIIPMLPSVPGLDLHAYADAVLRRFANPAIVHRLDQIAQDGSQKLPYRLGDTLIANRTAGRMPDQIVAALGAWVAFLMRRVRAGVAIVDPAAARLTALAAAETPSRVVDGLVRDGLGFPGQIRGDDALIVALQAAAEAAFRDQNSAPMSA
jgi:fructuronate reductase